MALDVKKMVKNFGSLKNYDYLCTAIQKIMLLFAPLAQLVEHLTLNQGVQSSNL